MELKQIEYSSFDEYADLSQFSLSKVDLLQSCWEPNKNWMQSINLSPLLAVTRWNSSNVERYIIPGGNCMGVITNFHAKGKWCQFYICDSRPLRFQPDSSKHSMFAEKMCYRPFLFTTRQFPTPSYMPLSSSTDRCINRVSRSTLSVPVGAIGGQHSTSTTAKYYCIDDHKRNWHAFPT